MCVVFVGKELNFLDTLNGFSGAAGLPKGGDAAVDKRRADGALFNGKKLMRGELKISRGEFGACANLETRTVTVVPGRRRMRRNFALQFELGNAAQVFPQDFLLDYDLMLVGGMLVVASAAAAEVRTGCRDAMLRGFHHCDSPGTREAGLFFGEYGIDFFTGQNKRNENRFPALGVPVGSFLTFVDGEANEPVSAIDQLFNV